MIFEDGKLYIDGKLREASNGAKYEDIDPWTGEIAGYAADASIEDMDEAIAAARRAFDTTDWPNNPKLRRELIVKLGDKLRANRERLVALARHEAGAPMGAIFTAQVDGPFSSYETVST